jgi:hypothetical protein
MFEKPAWTPFDPLKVRGIIFCFHKHRTAGMWSWPLVSPMVELYLHRPYAWCCVTKQMNTFNFIAFFACPYAVNYPRRIEVAAIIYATCSVVIKVLCYKSESRGFDTRLGIFLNLPNPSDCTRPLSLLSL